MGKKGKGRPKDSGYYSERVKQAFRLADKNNDKTLSLQELQTLLRDLDENAFTEEAVSELFARIDKDASGAVDMDEFIEWVFDDWIGREAVEKARQATLSACDKVSSASRIGSSRGDIVVSVVDINGDVILQDFGLYLEEPLLILRHAVESVMKRELGYRPKLLMGDAVLLDHDTVGACGLQTGAELSAVLTVDPQLHELLQKLPGVVEYVLKVQGVEDNEVDEDDMDWTELDKGRELSQSLLREVDKLGCFGLPSTMLLRDPPVAGAPRCPEWSGADKLGPGVPLFAEWLQHDSHSVRELACWCLGRAGSDALHLLPQLAAAAWDRGIHGKSWYKAWRVQIAAKEAAHALCLLATQSPRHVLPVLAELICHDDSSISTFVTSWLVYSGQSIHFWRPIPGAREVAKAHLLQALQLTEQRVSKTHAGDTVETVPSSTAKNAASYLTTFYPDVVSGLEEGSPEKAALSLIVPRYVELECPDHMLLGDYDGYGEEEEEEEEERAEDADELKAGDKSTSTVFTFLPRCIDCVEEE